MARLLRPYFPGGIFHITARTQGGSPWLDSTIRDVVCRSIAIVQRRCDVKLFAYVIMPNHLHLVIQQGDHPLSRFMQPLLTRVAIAVKQKYRVIGHVFGQRYWDHACLTSEYVTSCIAYVHNNPVKAGLCAAAIDYEWSSARGGRDVIGPQDVIIDTLPPIIPTSDSSTIGVMVDRRGFMRSPRDMEQIVARTIERFARDVDVNMLRALRGRIASRIRRECILQALRAGYRNHQIAKYLCVSDATVSRVAVTVRGNALLLAGLQDGSIIEDAKRAPKKIGQPKLPYSRG